MYSIFVCDFNCVIVLFVCCFIFQFLQCCISILMSLYWKLYVHLKLTAFYFILFYSFFPVKRDRLCVCIWMVNAGYALIKRTNMVKTNNITNKRAYQWNIVLPYLGEDVDREIVKAKKVINFIKITLSEVGN